MTFLSSVAGWDGWDGDEQSAQLVINNIFMEIPLRHHHHHHQRREE